MQSVFTTDNSGKLLVSKEALLLNGIYTDTSYRKSKCIKRFQEVEKEKNKYILVESLPEQTRKLTISKLKKFNSEYTQLLLASEGMGVDCVPAAIEFTAETLEINEPFIRSAIEIHINTHYTIYTWAYLDAGLHSNSVKGYAKQCALIQWIYDYVQKITTSEASAKRSELLIRSFRVNLLTALSSIRLEIKIPTSDTRFNKWLDEIINKIDKGQKPEDIVQIKRQNNRNSNKITDEQFKTAYYWYIDGSNMSVSQVYDRWIVRGKEAGWWIDPRTGEYCPPTEGRLYQLLSPLKNAATLEKTDAINYMLNMTPTSTRDLPENKNHVWVIDGTAHNENVHNAGKVKQYVYAIKVADVATLRLVGASTLIGVREPFTAVKEAILMGIRETGYKPAIIHCDHGPAWKELESWCIKNEIKLYPSMTGNARAKTIESLFNMFDNDITRFLKGYSGGNRTALSINSRSSEKRENKGKRNARSASIAMQWIKTEGLKAWNERVIKTLERKPCNKTPYELWDEKESFVPKLSYIQLCQLCGTRHDRKLTIDGLDIEHKTMPYIYFPPIETSEQRTIAANIFNTIPLKAVTSNILSIYLLEPGEPAPVFDHSGKYLGIWSLKPHVGYIDKTGNLDKFMALVYKVKEQANTINKTVQNYIAKHPDFERIEALGEEMLVGKRRAYTSRYDKSELLEEEIAGKANESFIIIEETPEYKEIADADTGEIHRVRINN